ncbi:phage tail sheath family protein [Mycetohabitans rhizoxinica]|uniref:Phage tail sheath family protein n=1 Tax=Mycetohabitans rhizoxinica TaxID=412963 RepID=A0ABZ2PTS3_9BURK
MGGPYKVPGVYIEEDHSLSLSVLSGATAIPVFVGQFFKPGAKQGDDPIPVATDPVACVRVNNWAEFTKQFYSAINLKEADLKVNNDAITGSWVVVPDSASAVSVQAYFENGGGPCYVLSIQPETPSADIESAILAYPDISLLCYCGNQSPEPENVKTTFKNLIDPQKNLGYFVLTDSNLDNVNNIDFGNKEQVAIYYPALQMKYKMTIPDDTLIKLGGKFKSFSPPGPTLPSPLKSLIDYKPKNEAEQRDKEELIEKIRALSAIPLRASGVMAGVYARTDALRGVWKAPANVTLSAVKGTVWPCPTPKQIPVPQQAPQSVTVTDEMQEKLNPVGINAIRYFTNQQAYVVWGARTQNGTDDNPDKRWRYIPVRRLFNAAERDIKATMRQVVFEPNSQPTWEKVRAAIDTYLYAIWSKGGLQGAKPEEAYFVQVGKNVTMTDADIRAGKMIVKVGIAAVRPAEFIILQFSQKQQDE